MISKKTVRILRLLAWAALACALALFNAPSGTDAPSYDSDAPVGHEVGQQLPDFTISTLDGGVFHLRDCRGKYTVLNLWATWCTPCVQELSHFDRLAQEYPEKTVVLAIHSDLVTDDVTAYLAAFDYSMPFAVDESGEVTAALGGSVMLPQTVVLDPYGVVTYNRVGSVSYEALQELIREQKK